MLQSKPRHLAPLPEVAATSPHEQGKENEEEEEEEEEATTSLAVKEHTSHEEVDASEQLVSTHQPSVMLATELSYSYPSL